MIKSDSLINVDSDVANYFLHFFLKCFAKEIFSSTIFEKILIWRKIEAKNVIIWVEELGDFDRRIKSKSS